MTVPSGDIVASFVRARDERPRWSGIPAEHVPSTVEDGYRVQAAVHDRLGQAAIRRMGYKVGSTSPEGQRSFGLSEPVYAGIFEDGRSETLRDGLARPLIAPMVECEIAVVLRSAIGPDRLADADIADAVASCHAACEIIDNRYGDPAAVGVPTMLADDFFHAGFVIGAANPGWKELDLGSLDAEVRIDGERFHGNASDVLSAFDAIRWLAGRMARTGLRLAAGDIVLTGAIVPPVPVKAPPRELSMAIEGFAPLRFV